MNARFDLPVRVVSASAELKSARSRVETLEGLLDRMDGMAYRALFRGARRLQYVSEGAFRLSGYRS
ncbi:MAG: hypothetical protein HGA47_08665, partial [Zoogloea sp.]|nr:hypothetical protein [Zoogloea sp.]